MWHTITGPPIIKNPLIDQVKVFNDEIALNCDASGSGIIIYQWQEFSDGSWMDISSGTSAEYKTRITESSQFRCVVSNEAGETTSTATVLILGMDTTWLLLANILLCKARIVLLLHKNLLLTDTL